MRILEIIKEIRNYFFVGKVLKKASKTKEWKEHKLRRGWFNVAYTVVNLPPEVFESEEIYYKTYVIEQLKPINEYLDGLNLSEVVSLEVEEKVNKENGEFAYLVKYEPIFRSFSLGWILKWSCVLAVCAWVVLRFDLISHTVAIASSIIQWIKG